MKTCSNCFKEKSGRFTKTGWCRSCYEKDLITRNTDYAERQKANSREWAKNNKTVKRYYDWSYHILQTYGISAEQYHTMLENQGGGCKLCGRKPVKNKLPVDHDHSNGRVRGILCTPCNRAVGIVEKNIDKLVDYLKEK